MKSIKNIKWNLLFLIFGTVMFVHSCEYQELADAAWPDQLIYMPAALYNNFTIDAVPSAIGYSPTPGFPTRFQVDTLARKFNVLLGVYRSGKDNEGTFTVDINVNIDTVTQLLAIPGKLPNGTILLTPDKYTIPTMVFMKDGSSLAKFDLSIDLDSMLVNYTPAGKIYSIAVGISSSARKTNEKYATTIIVVNTKILKPLSSFTYSASPTDPKTINFTNTSLYGTKYIWDFGDGTATRVTTSAKNEAVMHTYSSGTYTASLTVQGIADWEDKSVFTTVIVIP